MKSRHISIPLSVELTDESEWSSDKTKSQFFTMRCHFELVERQLQEPHRVGDVLAVYHHPKGVSHQHMISSTFEIEEVDAVEATKQLLVESEELASFATEISAKSNFFRAFNLDGKIKGEITEKFKNSFSQAQKIQVSAKNRFKKEFSITNQIAGDVTDPLLAVPVFKRCAYDIYLSYIDYLSVDYRRSLFGLRKKAYKEPPVIDHNDHPNRIKFGYPVATVLYWRFLPNSSKLIFEQDHKIEVFDREEIEVRAPEQYQRRHFNFPKIPTLYQIANAAFPKKWVLRKSRLQAWTEEELMAIEHDEVKEKKGWWFIHGPGSSTKKR
ncbi:MAG: hypothetical protein IPN64_08880 [Propionivibrio sp.]|uniref:hypothetical protein n=1 Tax=Propionivibrio sp. TaxID=2212460 RepID=UPI0025EB6FF6|nr:hypothetical protein [Propionivibrio sp.]MBK8894161.1 hypothetical protein [Propionivibrio sp.]